MRFMERPRSAMPGSYHIPRLLDIQSSMHEEVCQMYISQSLRLCSSAS